MVPFHFRTFLFDKGSDFLFAESPVSQVFLIGAQQFFPVVPPAFFAIIGLFFCYRLFCLIFLPLLRLIFALCFPVLSFTLSDHLHRQLVAGLVKGDAFFLRFLPGRLHVFPGGQNPMPAAFTNLIEPVMLPYLDPVAWVKAQGCAGSQPFIILQLPDDLVLLLRAFPGQPVVDLGNMGCQLQISLMGFIAVHSPEILRLLHGKTACRTVLRKAPDANTLYPVRGSLGQIGFAAPIPVRIVFSLVRKILLIRFAGFRGADHIAVDPNVPSLEGANRRITLFRRLSPG